MTPRQYQADGLDDLWAWFQAHAEGDPIVEACVGAGKSLMIALLAQRAIREYPGTRIIVLVHQKELLEQNLEKLLKVWPGAPLGVYAASAGRRQLGSVITYATIGSIYKQGLHTGRVDLILADECHLINPKQAGMWRQFIGDVRKHSRGARVIGWTGTPFRGNGVWLTHGEDALFNAIPVRIKMGQLLELGYLSPLVVTPTETLIDTTGVSDSGGDYSVADLAAVSDRAEIVQAACAEILRQGAQRKKWLVFAVNVEHAEHINSELLRLGVASDIITGDTPKAERAGLVRAYRAGHLRCLVNVGVLTTGFDVPEIDLIAVLRATKSPVLYVQIAGRGMRIADGKTDCLWLDFTTTTRNMGPVDIVTGRKPSKPRPGPTKLCDSCGSENPTFAVKCSTCGAAFVVEIDKSPKHEGKADQSVVLSTMAPTTQDVAITRVAYVKHVKPDSDLATMRVDYYSGMVMQSSEWVCFDHGGFPRRKAEQWWLDRTRIDAVPPSVDAAIEWLEYDQRILRQPSSLTLTKDGKFKRILSYAWNDTSSTGQDGDVPREGGQPPQADGAQLPQLRIA